MFMKTVAIVVISMFLSTTSLAQADDKASTLRAIATAYRSNVASFRFGRASFDYTEGKAADLSAALAKQYSQAFEGSGLFAFDGAKARYEIVYPANVQAKATTFIDKNKSTSQIISFRALTDGDSTLLDRLFVDEKGEKTYHSPWIEAGTENFYKDVVFPLEVGRPTPGNLDMGRDLMGAVSGNEGAVVSTLDLDAVFDGQRLAHVVLGNPRGTREYWIDLTRGAIPVRMIEKASPLGSVTIVNTDLRQVAGGWIPWRHLVVMSQGRVKDLVLKDVNFTERPAATWFKLDFPEPQSIVDSSRALKHAARPTWELAGLPKRPSSTAKAIVIAQAPGAFPTFPEARTTQFPWLIAGICGTIAVMALFFFYRVRRRRHAIQTS